MYTKPLGTSPIDGARGHRPGPSVTTPVLTRNYRAQVRAMSKKRDSEKDHGVLEEMLGQVLSSGFVPRLERKGEDWTACRCAMHVKMECGVLGAEGCKGLPPGDHPAIFSLYAGGHRACTMETGARILDMRCRDLVEANVARYDDAVKKFCTGREATVERFGAFYCYTALFRADVRARIARIMGPRPEKWRVIRYALLFGPAEIVGFQVHTLGCGDLHISTDGGRIVSLPRACRELAHAGEHSARVGTGELNGGYIAQVRELNFAEARGGAVGALVAKFSEFGLELPGVARVELAIVTASPGNQGAASPEARRHALVLAVVGDVALKMVKAEAVYSGRGVRADYDAALQRDTNGAMAMALLASDIVSCCDVGPIRGSPKALATMYEGIAGVVYIYAGVQGVRMLDAHVSRI